MVNDISREARMTASSASKWNITSQFMKSDVLQLCIYCMFSFIRVRRIRRAVTVKSHPNRDLK